MIRLERASVGLVLMALAVWLGREAQTQAAATERTTIHVLVKDASDKPIENARLTLRFREPGRKLKLKRSKMMSYSAKTNAQGRYKFTYIPKGTILLMVTADHHQTFGKEFEIETDEPVIEVKLKKPQSLL